MNAATFTAWVRERLSFERIFLLILLATLVLRLYSLDLKLFHHDEAIHAWFSYKLLTEGTYIYDPMYHGPFLYYTTAGIFSLLGDSDIVGRIIPALFGTFIIPLLYPIYKLGYLDQKQTLVAALFLAVSPSMVYFSRFLRNDIYIAFFSLALLVAILYYIERGEMKYALLAGAAAGFGMSTKENMPIVLLIFGVFLIYLIWTRRVRLPAHWTKDLVAGVAIMVGIMAVFYSSFGAHPEVLVDGWLRAIEHWTSMHQMERLGGPPYFYVMLLILYEIPILAFAVVGVLQFFDVPGAVKGLLGRRRGGESSVAESVVAEGDLVVEENAVDLGPMSLWDRFCAHFSRGEERALVNRREEFARFSIFWMLLSLAVYAYLGEKVPWLIVHQLLPMIFVAVYAMTTRKAAIAVLASVFLITMTFHVAFTPVDINGPIVQVQNSEDLRDLFAEIDAADRVAIASESYWPLPWYYRGEDASKLNYYSKRVDESTIYAGDFDLVITLDSDTYQDLVGYAKKKIRLNYWFSYNENKDRLLEYYFFRDGDVGSRKFDIFSRDPAPG